MDKHFTMIRVLIHKSPPQNDKKLPNPRKKLTVWKKSHTQANHEKITQSENNRIQK